MNVRMTKENQDSLKCSYDGNYNECRLICLLLTNYIYAMVAREHQFLLQSVLTWVNQF